MSPYIYEDRTGDLKASLIPCITLATITTILRFVSRSVCGIGINASDFFIAAALTNSICSAVILLEGINYGSGRPMSTVSPSDLEVFLKLCFAGEILYCTGITLTKIGILLSYCNIFQTRNFVITAKVVGGVVLAWAVATICTIVFACHPVAAFWDASLKPFSSCINMSMHLKGNAIPNIITDAFILVMPMPLIYKLHMSWQKRAMVAGVFLLGGFVLLASVLRLAMVANKDTTDFTVGVVDTSIWSNVEVNVAIFSANLPLLRPLVMKLLPAQKTQKTTSFDTNSEASLKRELISSKGDV